MSFLEESQSADAILVFCPICGSQFPPSMIPEHVNKHIIKNESRAPPRTETHPPLKGTVNSKIINVQTTPPKGSWIKGINPLVASGLSPQQRKEEEERELSRVISIAEQELQQRMRREAFEAFLSTKYEVGRLSDDLLLRIFSYLALPEQCRLSRVCKRFFFLMQRTLVQHSETISFLKIRELSRRESSKIEIPLTATFTESQLLDTTTQHATSSQIRELSKEEKKLQEKRMKEELKRKKQEEKKIVQQLKEKEKKEKKERRESQKAINRVISIKHFSLRNSAPPEVANPAVIPEVPSLNQIGWYGSVSRLEAEDILQRKAEGTFLTRWSNNTKSYVLSMKSQGLVQHVSGLFPGPKGQISVFKENGATTVFPHLGSYVDRMKALGVIRNPLDINEQNVGVFYHTE